MSNIFVVYLPLVIFVGRGRVFFFTHCVKDSILYILVALRSSTVSISFPSSVFSRDVRFAGVHQVSIQYFNVSPFFVCVFFTVCTRKTRILDVIYNASNNELVRTKTLVKNAIVVVSGNPARSLSCCIPHVRHIMKKRRADAQYF